MAFYGLAWQRNGWHCIGKHDTACYCMTLHGMALPLELCAKYNTVQCNSVQYSTLQYKTIRSTRQYSTIRYNTLLVCYLFFLDVLAFRRFLSCFCFCFVLFSCARWSFVDVPLIFSCPADHVRLPDWQPRVILLGMVEARSVNVKNTTTQKVYMRSGFS